MLTTPAHVDQPVQPPLMAATGRIGRVHYWGWSTMLLLAGLALSYALTMLSGASSMNFDPVNSGVTVVSIVGTVILARRRLQDVGMSAWWAISIIVPLVALVVLVWLSVAPGQTGTNRYGPEPAPASRAFLMASIAATLVATVAILYVAYAILEPHLGGDPEDLLRLIESMKAQYY